MTTTAEKMAKECIAVRIRMLNRTITNIYDDALRPHGVKVSQCNILIALANMQQARPSEIGTALHIDASTLSRNLERLKTRGWIETLADEDGRAQPVQLTANGQALIEQISDAWNLAQEKVKELMGSQFVSSINKAARTVSKL